MGVPGFVTWLEATAPEALVTIPYGAPPRVADVVAFDMNSLLHTALRSSRNEDRALISVFQKLHAAIACDGRNECDAALSDVGSGGGGSVGRHAVGEAAAPSREGLIG